MTLPPFHLAVAAVYGLLAAGTDATYPGIVPHAGGNLFSAFGFFVQGRSEWALTPSPPPTIWEGGVDASFLATVGGFVVVGGAAAVANRGLFQAARTARTVRA